MQFILTFIKLTIFVLAAGSVLLYFAQDHLIFHPIPTPDQNINTFKKNQLVIERNNFKLHGWLLKDTEKITSTSPLLIYYGGNAEEVSANLYESAKYPTNNLLFMNYRGYGQNKGKPSEENLYQDALHILDFVSNQYNIRSKDIILIGRSLGSGVAAYVASKRDVRAVILVTPYDSLLNIAKRQYPLFPVKLMLKHPFDSLTFAPQIKSPLLNLMAEHDTIIPTKHAKNLAKHWQGNVHSITIKGAGHNNITDYDQYWQAIKQFIEGL